jgi:hypothetical protein
MQGPLPRVVDPPTPPSTQRHPYSDAKSHFEAVAARDPCPPRNRRLQRPHRRPEPVRQEGQALRTWLPQLRALPTPRPAPRRRRHLASTTSATEDPNPLPTHSRRAAILDSQQVPPAAEGLTTSSTVIVPAQEALVAHTRCSARQFIGGSRLSQTYFAVSQPTEPQRATKGGFERREWPSSRGRPIERSRVVHVSRRTPP